MVIHNQILKYPAALFIFALLASMTVLSFSPPKTEAATLGQCNQTNDKETCRTDFEACEKRYEKNTEINRCENNVINKYEVKGGDKCGSGNNAIRTKFNFGCSGRVNNPILDLTYALISFLSAGVGVVVVIAIVAAGIRYSTSEGNPEVTMQAKRNIQNALIGLVIYIFAFAIINYLVPGGLF